MSFVSPPLRDLLVRRESRERLDFRERLDLCDDRRDSGERRDLFELREWERERWLREPRLLLDADLGRLKLLVSFCTARLNSSTCFNFENISSMRLVGSPRPAL